MYKALIRPILFKFNPEFVHHLIVNLVRFGFKIPGIALIVKKTTNNSNPVLKTNFLGMEFKNPVGFAAGFDKNAEVFNEFSNFGFSFIEIGTVTPKPQPGNAKPRSFRITKDQGLINRMGFNNKGADFAANKLQKNHKLIVGGNIGKNTLTSNENAIQDYILCFNSLYNKVDYFVINVSCPNVKDLTKLQDKDSLLHILSSLINERKKYDKKLPILLKISPDLNDTQLDEIIEIYFETGIDGIVATNTTSKRDNLKSSKELIDSIGNGGMSGKPITDRSTEVIKYLYEKSDKKIPIIGVGGIMTEQDAIDKLKVGAKLIQLYSGFIYEGPYFVKSINKRIVEEIENGNLNL